MTVQKRSRRERLEAAYARKREITQQVQEIQEQLANRNRVIEGRRVDSHEYWEWHRKAKHALGCKLTELREVKDQIRILSDGGSVSGDRAALTERTAILGLLRAAAALGQPLEEVIPLVERGVHASTSAAPAADD
jgi:hypothetical protein